MRSFFIVISCLLAFVFAKYCSDFTNSEPLIRYKKKIGAIFCKVERRRTILCYLFSQSDLQYKYKGIFIKSFAKYEDKFLFIGEIEDLSVYKIWILIVGEAFRLPRQNESICKQSIQKQLKIPQI